MPRGINSLLVAEVLDAFCETLENASVEPECVSNKSLKSAPSTLTIVFFQTYPSGSQYSINMSEQTCILLVVSTAKYYCLRRPINALWTLSIQLFIKFHKGRLARPRQTQNRTCLKVPLDNLGNVPVSPEMFSTVTRLLCNCIQTSLASAPPKLAGSVRCPRT